MKELAERPDSMFFQVGACVSGDNEFQKMRIRNVFDGTDVEACNKLVELEEYGR